ncbi:MAG: DUF3225 domain-containing protein, partial [Alphaproteobacteria bacterium]
MPSRHPGHMQIDDPAVIAEARAVFDRYEQAIATNDG